MFSCRSIIVISCASGGEVSKFSPLDFVGASLVCCYWVVAFSPRPAPEEDPLEYWVLLQVQDGVLSWWDFGTSCGCCGGGGSRFHQRGPVIFPDLAGGALGPPNLGL